jgi:hypothetical protein
MRHGENVVRLGAPGSGKTISTASSVVAQAGGAGGVPHSDGAEIILDPHPDGLVQGLLPHLAGANLLYENLSDVRHTLGFEMLVPSRNPDPALREAENQLAAEAFVELLVTRRGGDSLASAPLMEETVYACLLCYLNQRDHRGKTPDLIPFLLAPESEEFESMVSGCTVKSLRAKFRALQKLTPRGLRNEVASSSRLLNAVFRSPHFRPRCRGSFSLGRFLDDKGKLLVERGRGIGDDPMRVIMGAIIRLAWAHAEARASPLPTIRIRIDEATNGRLLTDKVLRGAAATNKWGLYWEFNLQRLDVADADDLFQLCHRHEFFRCPNYDLARRAAADILTGLPRTEQSRAERLAEIADDLTNLAPGWHWVRDQAGSRKELSRILDHPYPNWGNLRREKDRCQLETIWARGEFTQAPLPSGGPNETPSSTSAGGTPPSPTSSPESSSPADRWRRQGRKPTDSG